MPHAEAMPQPQHTPHHADTATCHILFTSDTHGCLTPTDYATGSAGAACLADFSGELTAMRAEGPTLFLDGGDTLQGTPLLRYWLMERDGVAADTVGKRCASVGDTEMGRCEAADGKKTEPEVLGATAGRGDTAADAWIEPETTDAAEPTPHPHPTLDRHADEARAARSAVNGPQFANPVATAFGALGLDAFTLGNHDFNYGRDVLADHVRAMSKAGAVCVCANVHDERGELMIRPHVILERGGLRIGITGVPGAGKSTFIEAVGNMVTSLRHKLAVLAIDPSSERSGGSILGDKTRMESICHNPDVFIRPSPSAGSLGGVARKTRETIVLCEAAGFDVIFIETVGVGQSETAVHSMVDMFMLLQISGAGDELQGIKRGIMEMADTMVITKADGENVRKAELARTQFQGALRLFPLPESGWRPKVYTCSAVAGTGLQEVWKGVEEFLDHIHANGYFQHNRNRQNKYWMYETINEALRGSFYRDPAVEARIGEYEKRVLEDRISSFVAAKELLELYFKELK